MEIKNNEGELTGVHLQENWKVWPKKRAVFYVTFLLVFFITAIVFALYVISQFDLKAGLIILAIAIGVFLLVNITTILMIFKPAEYHVVIKNDKLIITCNEKEMLSLTSQETRKIIVYRQDSDIEGIGIYEVEPDNFSAGVGYRLNLSYIPNGEIIELVKLLELFYGQDRLL